MAKAVDVVSDVGRKCRDGLLVEFTALLRELLQFLAHHKHIVEDHTVGDQVVELDDFALLFSAVFGDDAFPTKQHPLGEPIKRFTFVHGALQVSERP